jgi:hypothetical protein
MKFGVIVCPSCKKAKGVNLLNKTTKCVGCGKSLKIHGLKIFYKTDSTKELQQAIGLVNAELNGRVQEFKKILKQF